MQCDNCHGKGRIDGSDPDALSSRMVTCDECDGSGDANCARCARKADIYVRLLVNDHDTKTAITPLCFECLVEATEDGSCRDSESIDRDMHDVGQRIVKARAQASEPQPSWRRDVADLVAELQAQMAWLSRALVGVREVRHG